jgi:hypothetical protein
MAGDIEGLKKDPNDFHNKLSKVVDYVIILHEDALDLHGTFQDIKLNQISDKLDLEIPSNNSSSRELQIEGMTAIVQGYMELVNGAENIFKHMENRNRKYGYANVGEVLLDIAKSKGAETEKEYSTALTELQLAADFMTKNRGSNFIG